jgi:hypothetical protein
LAVKLICWHRHMTELDLTDRSSDFVLSAMDDLERLIDRPHPPR